MYYNCQLAGIGVSGKPDRFRCRSIEAAMTRLRLQYRNAKWVSAYVVKERSHVVVAHMLRYTNGSANLWRYA